jgi:hypothetical protein
VNTSEFAALMKRSHFPRVDPEIIVCDPETYEDMKANIVSAADGEAVTMQTSPPIFGMRIYARSVGKFFQPPRDRFIQYEDADLPWLEKLGIGKYCEIRYLATLKESAFRLLFTPESTRP